MNRLASLRRLASMDRDELAFRVKCGAHKIAGRVTTALRRPAWRRADLVTVLNAEAGPLVSEAIQAARGNDVLAAHRLLARHFVQRRSVWPLSHALRPTLPGDIRRQFPGEAGAARARGDRILAGRYDLLGYRDLNLGVRPAWRTDAVHQRTTPGAYWAAIPYLDPALGDHKIVWELNRHQHWLTLGAAHWMTGDPGYRDAAIAQLEDWLPDNPPLVGVNWASMLELAFRTISWTWALEFFLDGAENDTRPWIVDLLVGVDRQLTHIAHNLSTYFSPNTHLSGEALALYVVGTAFPELARGVRRAELGRATLIEQATRQIHADGGHAELSAHYHRYSTDFYLLALMVARAARDRAATPFEDAARRQANYLRSLADDDARLPLLGDDDGGQLFRFGLTRPADASATLQAAAILLDDPSLSAGAPTAEAAWIVGRTAPLPAQGSAWPSRRFPDTGYVISRTAGAHLIFDVGHHGFLNGGHAHDDALGVVLSVEGLPLFVDPGTATYTMDAGVRDRFRSARMHNTVTLDGADHAEPQGPFHWRSRPDARLIGCHLSPSMDAALGTHDAYAPRRHYRATVTLPEVGWLIIDRITNAERVSVEQWWHLHPEWTAIPDGTGVSLRHSTGRGLPFATTADRLEMDRDSEQAVVALEYGRVERATVLNARTSADSDITIATFVGMRSGAASLGGAGAVVAGAWVQLSYELAFDNDRWRVTVAFPEGPAQPMDEWPQPCIIPIPRPEMAVLGPPEQT